MRTFCWAMSGVALSALAGGHGAMAQVVGASVPAPTTPSIEPATASDPGDIIVTGFRQSLSKAQNIKRNASEIVDSIVAEDIGKLPDNNIAEALQRIPGIQITRNHGEGSGVAIRGLTQVKTLLNGREIFSDTGRDLSLENVPAELLAGVDVYKNPSATLIEGGLGGVINLKTRRPFDFDKPTLSVSARGNYYDIAKQVQPQFSALAATRFDTGIGEIGVLVNAAYLRSSGRLDQFGVEPFNDRYNIVDFNGNGVFPGTTPPAAGSDAGDRVISPNGGGNTIEVTDRERITLNGVVQYKPSRTLELFAEGTYSKYNYKQDSYSIFANRGSLLPAPGVAFVFYPDTNVVRSGGYRNVSFTSNTNYQDRDPWTLQIAGGGTWKPAAAFELSTDISYTRAKTVAKTGSLRIGNANPVANGPTLLFDTSTKLPTLAISGVSTNPADYTYINSGIQEEDLYGDSLTARLDATYRPGGVIESLTAGVRYADRSIDRNQGTLNYIPSGTRPIAALPGGLTQVRYDNFSLNTDTANLTGLYAPTFGLVRNAQAQCAAFAAGTNCGITFLPLNTYSQGEKTYAGYGQANFKFDVGAVPIDGNIGGRWLHTQLNVTGFRTTPSSGAGVAINQTSEYDNFLPSANVRAELLRGFYLRLAAAKQLTRPSFANLSPSLNLAVQTAVGLTGSAGNPDLRPLKSTSYDASLEWYFAQTGYVYLSGFLKKVDGFIQTITAQENVNLPDYPGFTTALITRPQNGSNGTIKGVEVGGQAFLDFLPSPLDGFGVQANYTYVDSSAPGPVVGSSVPLIGLSKNNINSVLFYEKAGFRARVAYNWRDDYVDTTSGPGSGALPIYAKPFGVLDASVGYRFNEHIDLTIDASNLTHARFSTYFGEQNRPRFVNVFDRRVGANVRVTF